VISLTKSLQEKPTAGDDDIPENLVKRYMQLIKGPLVNIYNLSLNSVVFPDIWKTAKVKPQYKKGDKYDLKNYRPISIIPAFDELLERLVYSRIISFLYENKILSEAPNGLRKGKSIDTTVQSFIGRIQKALDKRVHTIGIFIDLTKAYDVLNHKLLVEKLFYYGIRGSTNLWFRSYLTHRKQFIEICQSDSSSMRINRYRSSSMEINQGVPQCLVLGPLLFLLYTRVNKKVRAIFKLCSNQGREELVHCTVFTMPVEKFRYVQDTTLPSVKWQQRGQKRGHSFARLHHQRTMWHSAVSLGRGSETCGNSPSYVGSVWTEHHESTKGL